MKLCSTFLLLLFAKDGKGYFLMCSENHGKTSSLSSGNGNSYDEVVCSYVFTIPLAAGSPRNENASSPHRSKNETFEHAKAFDEKKKKTITGFGARNRRLPRLSPFPSNGKHSKEKLFFAPSAIWSIHPGHIFNKFTCQWVWVDWSVAHVAHFLFVIYSRNVLDTVPMQESNR